MSNATHEFVKSDNLLVQEIGEEVVILDLDTEVYFALDGVGLRIWQLLDETASLSEIADRLQDEYEVARDQALADLQTFSHTLLEKGLIRSTGQSD